MLVSCSHSCGCHGIDQRIPIDDDTPLGEFVVDNLDECRCFGLELVIKVLSRQSSFQHESHGDGVGLVGVLALSEELLGRDRDQRWDESKLGPGVSRPLEEGDQCNDDRKFDRDPHVESISCLRWRGRSQSDSVLAFSKRCVLCLSWPVARASTIGRCSSDGTGRDNR